MFSRIISDNIRIESMWDPADDTLKVWVKMDGTTLKGGYFGLHSSEIGNKPTVAIFVADSSISLSISGIIRVVVPFSMLQEVKPFDYFPEIKPQKILMGLLPDPCGDKGVDGPPGQGT